MPCLAFAFAVGVLWADRVGPLPGATWSLAAALGVGVALLWRRASPLSAAACAVALAFGLGAHALSRSLEAADRDRPPAAFDAALSGRVCAKRSGPASVELELCAVRVGRLGVRPPAASVPSRLLVTAPAGGPEHARLAELVPGDALAAWLRVEAVRGPRNPGARDRGRALARDGLSARARLLDPRLVARLEADRPSLASRWHRARQTVARRLLAAGPGGGLLAALGLGERRGLGAPERDAFRRLGIAHLLAVSGLHLALLGALAFASVRSLALRLGDWPARVDVRALAVGVALMAVLLYALAVGFAPPVRRAFVFALAAGGTFAVGRPRAWANTLAGAFLVVAVLEPAAVFSLGAQLSFVASAALGAVAVPGRLPRAGGRWARFRRSAGSGLRVSATAIAATAPLLAAHGLASAPVGLLSNAVAVPATAFVLLPLALGSVAVASLSDAPQWLWPMERLAALALEGARLAASWLPPGRPGAAPDTKALVLAGCLAIACARTRRTWARVLLCGVVCGWLALAPRPALTPRPPRIVAFDVGQGDSILLQGRQAAVLVDGGGSWGRVDLGRSVVVPALRALGVERLDLVVATHADADHQGGLPAVLAEMPVDALWLPQGAFGEPDFGSLRALAARKGIAVHTRGRGDEAWQRGGLRLEPLWPPAEGRRAGKALETTSRNHASLVVRASLGATRVLLTGDIDAAAERELLAAPDRLRAEILKVAHHGSASASSRGFLAAVAPDLALVSAPCSARRHLPSRAAMARLREAVGSLWWTGRDGALLVAVGPGDGPIDPRRGQRPTRIWGWNPDPGCLGP